MSPELLTAADYRTLLAFRTALTRFLHWRSEQIQQAGLTPQQHNLLLAVRAHPEGTGPSIRQIADQLVVQHHTAVGLVDRAQRAKLVCRGPDPDDRRLVRVRLTPKGRQVVRRLEASHKEELRRIAPALGLIFGSLGQTPPEDRRSR